MQTRWYHNLGLILLAFAIALSPRFSIGQLSGGIAGSKIIDIRIEDLILAGLILLWVVQFLFSKRTTFQKPLLFFPIALWLGFGLLTTLLNIILGNIEPFRAFFFSLKETEFFILYAYVFSHIPDIASAKRLLGFWLFLGLANTLWAIVQLVGDLRINYYYGPTLFAEPQNPLASGLFFVILFLFLFNVFLYYYANLNISALKKIFIAFPILLLLIGAFASGSQTAFASLIGGLFASLVLYTMKSNAQKFFLLSSLLGGVAVIVLLFFTLNPYPIGRQTSTDRIFGELSLSRQGSRINIWKFYLTKTFEQPLGPFIGFGKSFVGEAHDQYIRNFLETGIIGSILFLFLVFAIIKESFLSFSKSNDHFIVAVSAALIVLTCAMLIASIPAESFIYGAKISALYWFFTAITLSALSLSKKNTQQTIQDEKIVLP